MLIHLSIFFNGRITINLKLDKITILASKSTGVNAQRGLVHFGVRADNLRVAVDELKTKGVKFTREITQVGPSLKIPFWEAPESVPVELEEGSL